MKSDPGADPHHRWGRCPGFFNRKEKHRSSASLFPLAKLIWVDWLHAANIPKISTLKPSANNHQCISHNQHHHGSCIRRMAYEKNNESATDFAYALALARRKVPKQQIIARLIEERTDWTNHLGKPRKQQYLDRTVSKAISIIKSTPIAFT